MVTLALIGTGKWGQNYIKTVDKMKDCQIKYVVTHNYKELLNYKDIDGIIIATPSDTHAGIIRTFPNHYLLVEKPLTTNIVDAIEIATDKIMTGHIYLYNQSLQQKLRQVGRIGVLRFEIVNPKPLTGSDNLLWELAPHGVSLAIKELGLPKNINVLKFNNLLSIKLTYPYTICFIQCRWSLVGDKYRKIEVFGDKSTFFFDDKEEQPISPLEAEIREFMAFLTGIAPKSDIWHSIAVIHVLTLIKNKI